MIDYTQEIKEVLGDSVGLSAEQMKDVTSETNIASIGIDSLDLVEAVIELEKKFNISIELGGPWMDELVMTVGNLNKVINEQLKT